MTISSVLEDLLRRILPELNPDKETLAKLSNDVHQISLDMKVLSANQTSLLAAYDGLRQAFLGLQGSVGQNTLDLTQLAAHVLELRQFFGIQAPSEVLALIDEVCLMAANLKVKAEGIITTPPPNPQPTNQ